MIQLHFFPGKERLGTGHYRTVGSAVPLEHTNREWGSTAHLLLLSLHPGLKEDAIACRRLLLPRAHRRMLRKAGSPEPAHIWWQRGDYRQAEQSKRAYRNTDLLRNGLQIPHLRLYQSFQVKTHCFEGNFSKKNKTHPPHPWRCPSASVCALTLTHALPRGSLKPCVIDALPIWRGAGAIQRDPLSYKQNKTKQKRTHSQAYKTGLYR